MRLVTIDQFVPTALLAPFIPGKRADPIPFMRLVLAVAELRNDAEITAVWVLANDGAGAQDSLATIIQSPVPM